MKETEMWNKLKKLSDRNPILMQRIENRTGKIPDIYFASRNKNGWIELKDAKIYKDGYVKILFRPGQLAWIHYHLRYNHNVYLIFTIHNDWFLFNGHNIGSRYDYNVLKLCRISPKEIIKYLCS